MCCGRLEADGGEDAAAAAAASSPKKAKASKKKTAGFIVRPKAKRAAKKDGPGCDCGDQIGQHRRLTRLGLQGH